MDAKRILQRLQGEADRKRTSLYLSESIMNNFKEVCGDVSPSKVMEELMLEFISRINTQDDAEESQENLRDHN